MPKLETYESRTGAPQPTAPLLQNPEAFGGGLAQANQTQAQATGAIGQHVDQLANVIGKRLEQDDVSTTQRKLAEAASLFTEKWREGLKTADPNDKDYATRFMEEWDDHVEGIRSEVGTRAGQVAFDSTSSNLKRHFTDAANASLAELQGQKAVIDYETTRDSYQATVLNDPSGLDLALHEMDKKVDETPFPNAVVAEKARIDARQSLGVSAVQGWIRTEKDPRSVARRLIGGEWDQIIDGKQKQQLLGLVDQEVRSRRVDAEYQRQQIERAKKTKLEGELSKWQQAIYSDEGVKASDLFTSKDYATIRADGPMLHTALTWMEMRNSGSKTNPPFFNDVFQRVIDPNHMDASGNNDHIDDLSLLIPLVGPNKLTPENYNFMLPFIDGKKTPEGRMRAEQIANVYKIGETLRKAQFGRPVTIQDEERAARFKEFIALGIQTKSKKELDEKYLNSASPDYWGRADFVKQWDAPFNQKMKEAMDNMRPKKAAATIPEGLPTPEEVDKMPEADFIKFESKYQKGGLPPALLMSVMRRRRDMKTKKR